MMDNESLKALIMEALRDQVERQRAARIRELERELRDE